MMQGPVAFGVQHGIKIRMLRIQQFLRTKAVKTQQPISLVQSMLTQKRRLGIRRREQRVFHNRHIGGIEYAFEPIGIVE